MDFFEKIDEKMVEVDNGKFFNCWETFLGIEDYYFFFENHHTIDVNYYFITICPQAVVGTQIFTAGSS